MFSAAQIQAASGAVNAAKVAADKRIEKKQAVRPDGTPRPADEVVLNVQAAQSVVAMHATKREHDEDSAEEEAARQDSLKEQTGEKPDSRPRLDVQG